MISVIFPAYNEEDTVVALYRKVFAVLKKQGIPFEIIAVDDGSTDRTLEQLASLSPIKIVVLARNMGQATALDAGFKESRGDVIVTLDADLQNDPEDIPKLLEKLNDGYDAVSGWRAERFDSFGRRLVSRLANWITYKTLGLKLHDFAGPMKVFRSKFIKDVTLHGDMHSFLPAILLLRGARICEVAVSHYPRRAGKAKYNTRRVARIFGDLMVLKFMSDHMASPFRFFAGWGMVSFLLGVITINSAFIIKFLFSWNLTQTPLPTLSALFVMVGVTFVMMGFLAEIILRTHFEGRGRTLYVIKDIIER